MPDGERTEGLAVLENGQSARVEDQVRLRRGLFPAQDFSFPLSQVSGPWSLPAGRFLAAGTGRRPGQA